MTTNNKLYSLAEQNVYTFSSKDEKKALINNDPTVLKQDLRHYIMRAENIKKQVKDYHRLYAERKQNYMKLLAKKEKEIEDQKIVINNLTTTLQKLKKDSKQKMDDLMEEYLKKREITEIELNSQQGAVQTINETLKSEQRHIDTFPQRDKGYISDIETLKEKLEKEEMALTEERMKFQKAKEDEEEFFVSEKDEIENIKTNIKETELNTTEEKQKFEYEKVEQQKQLDFLRSQRQKILDKHKSLKRDIQLNDDGLSEYQTLNYQQARKIKNAKIEVQYIKYRLSEELYKFTQQMEDLKRHRGQMTEELEMKIKQIIAHIEQKNHEAKNFKFLSRAILSQKADVDSFFLDSIEYVKEQIKVKNASQGNPNKNLKINQFPLTSRQINAFAMCLREPSNKPQLDPNKKVDITDLDWEEKEKIIRILYTKVNMGVSPAYWKHLANVQKDRPGEIENDEEDSENIRDEEEH